MNILYICPNDPRDTSFGGAQRTHFIWKALKSCGTVYAFCPQGGKVQTVEDAVGLVRQASVDSPNPVFFLLDRLILRLTSGQIRLPFRSSRFIRSRIGWPEVKFDCVVVRYIRYAALVSAWKLAPKCIVDIDDLPTQAFGGMGRFRRWLLFVWQRHVLRRVTLSWFPNEDLIPQIAKMCPCRFLPNLAMPPRADYQVSGKQKRQLMSVGWMAYRPNHEGVDWFVREVWPKVHAVHPDLKYVIAGKEAPADCVRRWSAVPGVEVLGFVEDLDSLYEESLAVVAPVFSGSGTCIKVQEAGLRGRTVFATPFAARGMAADAPFLKVSNTAELMRRDLLAFLDLVQTSGEGCCPAVGDPARIRMDFEAEVFRGVHGK